MCILRIIFLPQVPFMPRKYTRKNNPRPPMPEWAHFITVTERADGVRLVVKCRYCGWQRSAHASRCASHFYRLHSSQVSSSSSSDSGSAGSQSQASQSHASQRLQGLRQSSLSQFSDRYLRLLCFFAFPPCSHRPLQPANRLAAEEALVVLKVTQNVSYRSIASKEFAAFVHHLRADFKCDRFTVDSFHSIFPPQGSVQRQFAKAADYGPQACHARREGIGAGG